MDNFYGDLASQAGSDNESEVSDVDPAQMAKMLESPSIEENKGKPTKTFKSQDKSASSGNKKQFGKSMDYGDFDDDDPLGDLLSDDDSLGEKKKTSVKPKESVTKKTDVNQGFSSSVLSPLNENKEEKKKKAKVIADLFGLEDKDETSQRTAASEALNIGASSVQSAQNLRSTVNKSEDWLGLDSQVESQQGKSDSKKQVEESKVIGKSAFKPKSDEALNEIATNVTKSSLKVSRRKGESVKFDDDDDDLLGGMGFESDRKSKYGDSNKPMLGASKPKSILDELLGKGSSEKERDLKMPTAEVKKSVNKSEMAQDSSVSFGSYSPSNPSVRESRRSGARRSALAIGDPLGLFSPPVTPQRTPSQEVISEVSVHNTQRAGVKSDWLGLSNKEERLQSSAAPSSLSPDRSRLPVSSEVRTSGGVDFASPSRNIRNVSPVRTAPQARRESVAAEDSNLPEWLGGTSRSKPTGEVNKGSAPAAAPLQQGPPVTPTAHQDLGPLPSTVNVTSLSLLAGARLEQEAAIALQQQEIQLMAALKLQQHEVHLAAMQQRQKVLLDTQEKQLQELLSRQQERQMQLEAQLKLQQDRISGHVQALLSQPTVFPVTTLCEIAPVSSPKIPEETEVKEHITETQVALQRSELEKSYLESTMEKLKNKHREEVELLEESYKRQIQILEESLERQDKRLRAENQRLEFDYQERITRMQDQHIALVKEHAQHVASLQQERITDLERLRQQQGAMLEHVKMSQVAETAAVNDASSHMTVLQATLEQLGRNTGSLSELQSKLDHQHDTRLEAREATVKAKETELQVARESLTRQREAAEEERKQLMGLITQLETKLFEQRQVMEEERWTLRQDVTRQDAKVQAFNKERERSLEQLERDREHIQNARQSILEEQQTALEKLREEKLSLAAEKSRLETLASLHGNSSAEQVDVAQLRAEVDSALKVAREETRHAEGERRSLREQQRQLDSERRRLQELEQDLAAKAQDLETLSQTAVSTRAEGLRALAEARQLEQQQSSRAAEMQRQLTELRDREQRVAQEKLSLSQDRLSLRKIREQRLCSYCKGSMEHVPFSPDQSLAHSLPLPDKFVDPKVVIMKLISEKERDGLDCNIQFLSSLHSASK